jgi:uncharacterized protein YaeQ
VALTATIHNLDVEIADVDRGVYETLSLRIARHPSESDEYLVTRILAYCLEYEEGIAFSKGLSDPDEPAILVRDLTGAIKVWIEVGAPEAARLHKASKAAARVVIYTHRDPVRLREQWAGERIHRADELELRVVDRAFLNALIAKLDRRMKWTMSVTGGQIYVAMGDDVIEGVVSVSV